MAESPAHIVDAIIQFIETEREQYGDFAISNDELSSLQTVLGHTSDDDSTDPEEDHSSNNSGMSSQEALFDENKQPTVYQKLKECSTLEELEALCQTADELHTDLEDTNLVFGVGNPTADLMIIGEAPGANEDAQGEPFVGKAGQLLNKILAAVNFDRDDVYIANILKHRPPGNRNPNAEERERSLPFLLRQIDIVDPKLILCVGKIAAQTLLKKNNASLKSLRGTFHSFRGNYELMATYHPAALLRNPNWKRPTWEDVQQLRQRYDELNGSP